MDTFDSAASFAVNRTFSMRYRCRRAQIASADPQIDEKDGASRRSPKSKQVRLYLKFVQAAFFALLKQAKPGSSTLRGRLC